MAQITKNNTLQVIATKSARVKDLVIKDGQLIFVQDAGRIALDFNGSRVFYNQITELETELDRTSIVAPSYGYYFVIETAILWFYRDGWIQVTSAPSEVVFVDVDIPALGQKNKLYVDKIKKQISIWDDTVGQYVVIADSTSNAVNVITNDEINSLFK